MFKKSAWILAVTLSFGLLIFQSCAAPSSTATITSTPEEKPKMNVNTIQVVNFNLEGITHNDFMGVANEVAPNFAPLTGLIKKVWLSDEANNAYGGVYSWEGQSNLDAYRSGELYAGALANNPNFVNLSDKGFDVLEGPTSVTGSLKDGSPTYIQVINFNLKGITHDDFMGVGDEVAPNFATLPGLISKVWLSDQTNNTYGGVYYWESQDACEAYRNGELYAGALTNNPNFSNLSDKGFDVLEGPSRVTHMK
jgi:hypothetical protein